MKKTILFIFVIFVFSCNEKPKESFSLTGKTNGLKDGTVIYLKYTSSDRILDSTTIQKNYFRLQTKLLKEPTRLFLRINRSPHYRFFWAEDKPMTFDASKSDFRHAVIGGSETENLNQKLFKEIDTLKGKERSNKEKEFVENYPNSIISANMLSIYSTTWGKEKVKYLFNKFSTENKNSEYGKKIQRYIELNKNPQIGDQFVDFEMPDTSGTIRKLSESIGKVALLEFWASWCGPCRQENPNLVNTYKKFHPKGFEIFAVSLDGNKKNWITAIKEDNLIWNQVSDLQGSGNEAGLIYGVNGIPDNFLISENGKIIGRNLRGEELNKKLKEILN